MTFKEKYDSYVKKNFDKCVQAHLDDKEKWIRENNTEELHEMYKLIGYKPECKLEELDEYIAKELKRCKKIIEKDFRKNLFNIDKLSKHNSKYDELGIDILKTCKHIRNLKYEVEWYLMFKEVDYRKYEYLGYVEAGNGDLNHVGQGSIEKTIRSIVANNPECDTVVSVHNHPYFANAIPSINDGITTMKLKEGLGVLGIKLYDSCIITGMDFYSRRQADKAAKNNRIILKQKYPRKLLDELLKKNKYLVYSFIDKREMLNDKEGLDI